MCFPLHFLKAINSFCCCFYITQEAPGPQFPETELPLNSALPSQPESMTIFFFLYLYYYTFPETLDFKQEIAFDHYICLKLL
jgi:hypothetical protein